VVLDPTLDDVARLVAAGERIVLVHGGSHETNVLATALGHPPRFVTSVSGVESRYTDRETLEIFAMAAAGKVSTLLVEGLQARGVDAIGLSGIDGGVLRAERKGALKVHENGKIRILRDDFTGRVVAVNHGLLELLLARGHMPVIAPLALGDGVALNVDGDRAAAAVAAALRADTLVILSNVPGLLEDVSDPGSLVRTVARGELDRAMDLARGRMKKKVMGAREALAAGVGRVVLADARVAEPVRRALAGEGTVFA
jgi:acetylglutamate/LysW-gamma-L-alpha-aminoadipate kinase